jgi:hypothetical protein
MISSACSLIKSSRTVLIEPIIFSVGFETEYWYALTSKCFGSSQAGSWMRAHNAVDIIIGIPELIQETNCKSSLSMVPMYYELSNPTHSFVIVCPTAGERVTGKMAVNDNPHVRACSVIR